MLWNLRGQVGVFSGQKESNFINSLITVLKSSWMLLLKHRFDRLRWPRAKISPIPPYYLGLHRTPSIRFIDSMANRWNLSLFCVSRLDLHELPPVRVFWKRLKPNYTGMNHRDVQSQCTSLACYLNSPLIKSNNSFGERLCMSIVSISFKSLLISQPGSKSGFQTFWHARPLAKSLKLM